MPRLNSFFARLFFAYALLLLLFGGAIFGTIYHGSIAVQRSVFQQIHWLHAEHVANTFHRLLHPHLQRDALQKEFYALSLLFPWHDYYVLDAKGDILLASSALKEQSVSLEPITAFLSAEHIPRQAILGSDPASSRPEVFSVTPLRFSNSQGFLYVILRSKRNESAIQMFVEAISINGSLAIATAVFLVSLSVGFIVLYVLTQPLRRMTAAVESYRGGEYHARTTVSGNDELSRHAEALNSMAATIEQNISDLKETDELRRSLIANVSHDLRLPLSVIQSGLETMLRELDSLSTPEAKDFVSQALRNVHQLRDVITDLFELSKLEAKEREPELVSFSIAELCQDIYCSHQPKSEQAGVTLSLKLDEKAEFVRGDIAMIDRVLSNLLENAIRYSGAGSTVELNVQLHGELVELRVRDTGPGIPAEECQHLFNRFYRAPSTRGSNTNGSGLGLAIAAKIAELHGTTLRVESTVGVGTSFFFSLPRTEGLSG